MNKVRNLFLGTAAGLVAVAGAQAADMPVKAKPVQYVKICSLYGDGFYYIPGTDTCLKMGGYLRIQSEYNAGAGGIVAGSATTEAAQARFTRDHTNDFNYRSRAAISWDVRQQTEYGTLRTFIRTGIQATTPADTEGGAVFIDRAFLQFAGFTVGKTQSLFDLFSFGGAYSYHNTRTNGDTGATGVSVWAYTAQFGNGFSGTLSLENPQGHSKAGTADLNTAGFFGANGAAVNDAAFAVNAGGNGFRMPDVIGNLRVDEKWGFAGVSVVLHDASGAYYLAPNNVNNGHPADKLGWAVAVGGRLNLPGGDMAGINVVYSEGAVGYASKGATWQIYDASTSVGYGWATDGVFANGTEVELTRVWSINAAYEHRWDKKWKTNWFGGYVNVDYNSNATTLICANQGNITPLAGAQPAGFNCSPDFSFYQVGQRTAWNPVSQLEIGLETMYTRLNTAFKGPANVAATGSRPAVTSIDDQGVWSAFVRWQRNFYP
jgi:porin-like protein